MRESDARHRPVFCPAPGLAGRPVPFPPKGRAERQGVSPRPRRHVPEHMAPCARKAHGKTSHGSSATPAFRTRMDFAACCMSQGLSLAPTRPRSCELSPGHALGPSARLAGVCPSPPRGSAIPQASQGSGIVAATASRSAFRRRSPRAPYRDGMADKFSSARGKVKRRRNKVQGICFLKIRNTSSLRGAKATKQSSARRQARQLKRGIAANSVFLFGALRARWIGSAPLAMTSHSSHPPKNAFAGPATHLLESIIRSIRPRPPANGSAGFSLFERETSSR